MLIFEAAVSTAGARLPVTFRLVGRAFLATSIQFALCSTIEVAGDKPRDDSR
jgi:hypothetical protein